MGGIFKNSNFTLSLLNCYGDNIRIFPWRSTNDPCRIWLSEIMLQQARVKTVIAYYNAWLNDLPNINSVARSSLDYILKKWEGLVYYDRDRNFHSACMIVMNKYNGRILNN